MFSTHPTHTHENHASSSLAPTPYSHYHDWSPLRSRDYSKITHVAFPYRQVHETEQQWFFSGLYQAAPVILNPKAGGDTHVTPPLFLFIPPYLHLLSIMLLYTSTVLSRFRGKRSEIKMLVCNLRAKGFRK